MIELNIPVVGQYSIPDELGAIEQTLARASEEADIVLVTGGLGPTDDDLARHRIDRKLPRGKDQRIRFYTL